MEPTMIDYYNELPQMVHIIDNMNQELADPAAHIDAISSARTVLAAAFG